MSERMSQTSSPVRSSFLRLSLLLAAMCSLSDCYDPLDPNGNITVTFDIHAWITDGYVARVTIQNYYQYRHIDKPGWKLRWTWAKDEVIWSMIGAFASQRGNCSAFKTNIPHSCVKDPVILDLISDAPTVNRTDGCCRGSLLSARAIDPATSFSSFEITVGNLNDGNISEQAPSNLTLSAPGLGYTCSPLSDTDPTVSSDFGGRRQVQVFRTWKSTCTYSPFVANKTPMCCVSLSSFYSPMITSCPSCSCGCRGDNTSNSCIREAYNPISKSDVGEDIEIVQCTDHMCPVRVHWHIKNNYMNHWRVKLTVSNYNFHTNYSDWNVLVQHPGFGQKTTTYSFNSTVLPANGFADDMVALFWGIENYNKELIHYDELGPGSVTTEIVINKDSDLFTFSNGWAFPRRLYFNGEYCEMSLPEKFPMLPNYSSGYKPPSRFMIFLLICLISGTLFTWF